MFLYFFHPVKNVFLNPVVHFYGKAPDYIVEASHAGEFEQEVESRVVVYLSDIGILVKKNFLVQATYL